MNFTCNECNDSGSRDKLGTYLDCNACGTAATRRDLNDFVKSLGPTHPEDVALAIHKRALAMAPKQEEPEPAPEIRTVLRDALASGLTMAYGCSRVWSAWGVGTMSQDDFYPASECDDLLDELCDLAIAALRPDIAAPAAANGALTDADILGIIWKYSSFISVGNYSSTQFDCQADTLNCVRAILAAAGPDAAQELIASLISLWDSKHLLADDYIEQMSAIEHQMRALSGAKGN